MSDAVVNVTINGVTTAVKDFNELADALANVNKQAEITSEEMKELGKQGKKAGEDAAEGVEKADEATGPFSQRIKTLKEDFKGLFSDVKKGFVGGVNAIKGFGEALGLGTKASKGLAVGLAALGIPLLIAAVSALIDYFKNLEGGMKVITTVTNVLGAVVGKLTEAFGNLLSGDFSGFVDSIFGIGKAAGEAVKNTDKLFKAQKNLADLTRKFTVDNANLKKNLEEQKKILEDTTLSYDQRQKALQKINAATTQLAKNQVILNKAQLAELQLQLSLEKNYEKKRELQQQIAEAQATLIESETELNNVNYDAQRVERELQAERKAAAAERKQNAKDVADTLNALRLKTLTDELEVIKQTLAAEKQAAIDSLKAKGASRAQLQQLEQYYDQLGIQQVQEYNDKKQQETDAANKTAEEKQTQADATALQKQRAFDDQLLALQNATAMTAAEQLQNEYYNAQQAIDRQLQDNLITQEQYQQLVTANDALYAQKRVDLAQQELDQKKALQEQQIAAVGATFGELASLLGEESQAGKNAASAEALIQAYLSANKAYASLAGIPVIGPALGAAAASIAVIAGLKNVQKIQSTKPKAATGGLIVGPSHSRGGVPIEAEGGEFVINRAAMGVPGVAGMAAMLNSVARPKYANGGIVTDINEQQAMFNQMASMPVKTYVLANDVTSAQQASWQIENLSRL